MPAHHPPSAPDLASAARAATRDTGTTSRTHLSVEGVSHAYPDRRVLSGITFSAAPGDRIGLIGENGTGKSTLLRILAGVLPPERGIVSPPGSIGLLEQELPYPESAPISRVLDDAQQAAVTVLQRIESLGEQLAARPQDPAIAAAYAAALEDADQSDAWSAEARRGETLGGLGLGGIPLRRTVGELSGGQRLRLALAALLLKAPHTLLLDEPSNHLDDASAAYLELVLAAWPGIVIVASHDRALLDAVCTRILDLDALPVPASVLADAAGPSPASMGFADRAGHTGCTAPAGATPGVRTGATTGVRTGAYASPDSEDTGSGLGVRVWGMGYTAARAARQAELARWRERYAAEQAERAELIHEIEVGSREVNRKHESKSESKITRKFYADKDARVTARRARNARVRLESLERIRVRRPPEPLRFSGFAPGSASGSAPLSAPGSHSGSAPGPGSGSAPPPATGIGDAHVRFSRTKATLRDPDSANPAGAEPARVEDSAAAQAPLLRADRVALAGRLRETSLEVTPRGRIMLTGPNGAGKSTLLAILAGDLQPDHGTVERGARVGSLPQEVSIVDPTRTASAVYRDAVGYDIAERAPLLATGLLAPRDLDRPVGRLSVGQRRRLALAALVADPPAVLLLDEPSNHLSLTLVEELEAALREFTGALVIATHDRWLRSRWPGETRELTAPR
ncbi:ATP-binding cassette domain-containing protein [Leucobacter triazinivorans]|uniref:ABC-F family ATP-binding cassette domain-containing protein n=1 Tax=Leucobacter triazinivorans TaxID=1784719 RepID=A0A4V0Z1T7_9MICO|nr:ATP-binding cassette domain-containing protein [Leucobacter triazinivorans]QBE49549.1 ABC-F family ATP-binding cassette domain-containing protein [Leucobacter triazinivorans]